MRLNLKKWRDLRANPYRRIFHDAFAKWRKDKGEVLRFRFPDLTAQSVVFDVGGFEGNWAHRIHAAHGSTLHVFEPHPGFAAQIAARFEGNDKIHLHAIALGSADGTLSLSDEGDASSAIADHTRSVTGDVVEVGRFFAEHGIDHVDLMKVNIEGGEYDLLPALISAGLMPRIDLLQVQFHLYSEADIAVRAGIRAQLAQTHDCVWEYPFVWEQWRLKKAP
ncbi:MAG: FkbM family methyltransferase [Paracoccaceae bacterium]